MFDQLLQKVQYLGVLDHFDFVEQHGEGQGAQGNLLKQVLGTRCCGKQTLLKGQEARQTIGQQAQEALQVVVGSLQVDPQHLFAGPQAMFAVLLQQRGFAETRGGTHQYQPGGVGTLHLQQKP
ncbi:hypothetical protein D9M71_128770 [compost metagenome]